MTMELLNWFFQDLEHFAGGVIAAFIVIWTTGKALQKIILAIHGENSDK